MLTDLEKRVIAAVQGDIPIKERPFSEIAAEMGIEEDQFLQTLRDLCDRGVVRRFGATIRHQKSGFGANVMVAWRVEEERVDAVGPRMASFRQVSHCYRRNPTEQWPYNLYTMVHAADEASCREIAHQISETSRVDDYLLLFSRRELKKTSMKSINQLHMRFVKVKTFGNVLQESP